MVSVFETAACIFDALISDCSSTVEDSGNDDVDAADGVSVAGDVTVVVNSFNLFESQLFGTLTPIQCVAKI